MRRQLTEKMPSNAPHWLRENVWLQRTGCLWFGLMRLVILPEAGAHLPFWRRSLTNYIKSYGYISQWNQRLDGSGTSVYAELLNISPTVGTYSTGQKVPFKILLYLVCLNSISELQWRCEINVVFT